MGDPTGAKIPEFKTWYPLKSKPQPRQPPRVTEYVFEKGEEFDAPTNVKNPSEEQKIIDQRRIDHIERELPWRTEEINQLKADTGSNLVGTIPFIGTPVAVGIDVWRGKTSEGAMKASTKGLEKSAHHLAKEAVGPISEAIPLAHQAYEAWELHTSLREWGAKNQERRD